MARRRKGVGSEMRVTVARGATIQVRRRERETGLVQLNALVPEDLATQVHVFAIERALLVRDIVASCIRAVVGARAPAA